MLENMIAICVRMFQLMKRRSEMGKDEHSMAREKQTEGETNQKESEQIDRLQPLTVDSFNKGKERNKGEERRVKERHTNSPGSEQKPTLVFIMVEAGANTKQIRGAMKSFCECVRARVLVCPEKTVTVDRADIVWADTAGSEGARAGEHI